MAIHFQDLEDHYWNTVRQEMYETEKRRAQDEMEPRKAEMYRQAFAEMYRSAFAATAPEFVGKPEDPKFNPLLLLLESES